MNICQLFTGFGEPPKVLSEGNMRQIPFEVHLVFLTISRMVQERIGIVEDVPFGDSVISVVDAEFCQYPIRDVLLSVCAIFVVGIEGKALGITCEVEIMEWTS